MSSLFHDCEKWSDSPYINHFIQPDTIIPNQANPQSWNRYSYVFNNPIQYTDPEGRCPWCLGAAVGAVIGAAVGAGAYYVANKGENFDWGEMAVAAGGGAVAGALIGSGIGLVASATTAAASATVAGTSASLISAGTSMAATGGSYIAQTSGGGFETKPFVVNTAVAGATAYLSYGSGPGTKLLLDVAGAEMIYGLTSEEKSVTGFLASGAAGLVGGIVDIGLNSTSTMLLDDLTYSPKSFMGSPNAPFTGQSLLTLGVKQRLYAAGRSTVSGSISSVGFNVAATYVQNKVLRERVDEE